MVKERQARADAIGNLGQAISDSGEIIAGFNDGADLIIVVSEWKEGEFNFGQLSVLLPVIGSGHLKIFDKCGNLKKKLDKTEIIGVSLSDVSKSLFKTNKLPENFITKAEAKALGWNPRKGNLAEVAPGKSIGGDIFGNREGLLPSAPDRTWFEADLNYGSGFRGSERLLYSNDGLLYYTGDHYKTFQQIGAQ